MNPFAYVAPGDLTAALAELRDGEARAYAGGTDLLPELKSGSARPGRLVHLRRSYLPELTQVADTPAGGLTLGPLVTLAALTREPRVAECYPALREAAARAATPQLRNAGTLGGNLRQQSRCEYYRHNLPCLLRGGPTCGARAGDHSHHAIFSQSDCISAWPSDPATALLALAATVRLTGPGGSRELALDDFYTLPAAPAYRFDALAPGELITAITLPPPPGHQSYRKAMDRATWAFALASLAAAVELDGDRVVHARLACAGVAPIPWRLHPVEEALIGASLSDATTERACAALRQAASPLPGNTYKVDLLEGLLREALDAMGAPA